MSPEAEKIVHLALKSNASAIAFIDYVVCVAHTWDDLIDKDNALTDDDIHRAFWLALVEIPNNAFYATNRGVLQPILINAIINWRIANEIERGEASGDSLKIAFIIRSAYVDLVTMSAALIGGTEWAIEHGPSIREWTHGEGFTNYLASLDLETAARKGINHGL